MRDSAAKANSGCVGADASCCHERNEARATRMENCASDGSPAHSKNYRFARET